MTLVGRYRAGQAVLVVAIAIMPVLATPGIVTSLTYIGLDCLVAIGLVLLTGAAGLTSFGQAAFCGIGAYATAILTLRYGWTPIASLPASLVVTAVAALAIGAVTVRLAGHYLVLGTLAWGIAVPSLLGNLPGLGGFNGFTGLPPVSLFGMALGCPAAMYWLTWVLVGLVAVAAANLLDSRVGRAMRALPARTMAESVGVPTGAYKVAVFVIAASFAGLAGWAQAHLLRVVAPGPFNVVASLDDMFMVVIGGVASLGGALLGPAVFQTLQDLLRQYLPALVGNAGSLEVVAFGLLVMLLLQAAPAGLMPLFGRWLPDRPLRRAPGVAAALDRRTQPAAGRPVLRVEGLVKRFGGLVAVGGVGFELNAGEILAVIGPNGAGKSTLFNLLTGILRSDAGRISLFGQRIDRLGARRIAMLGVARTFQHVVLRPGMSVLENVALGAHGRGRKGMLAAVLRLDRGEEASLLFESQAQLDRVGLGTLAGRPASTLALGQQRILEIARALAADPCVLLLDEPAAGLRHGEKQDLAALLGTLRGQGVSILLVEHDMTFVMDLVDRVVVVDFGTKIAEGAPDAIQRDPRVLEAYLGGVDEPNTVAAVS